MLAAIAGSATPNVNRSAIARLYNRHSANIHIVNHDAAFAIKVSFPRPQSSGSKLDSDVYVGQQHVPLLELEFGGWGRSR